MNLNCACVSLFEQFESSICTPSNSDYSDFKFVFFCFDYHDLKEPFTNLNLIK